MTGSYLLWKSELQAPTPEDRRGDRATDPKLLSGFFRINAAKTKPDYPVAIWTEAGQDATIFQIGNKVMNTVEHETEWHEFVARSWLDCTAVTKADWSQALETKFWPDGKPATRMSDEEKMGIDVAAGGNNPPIEESLADQIAALVAKAKATPEPQTQEEADAATGIVDKLRKLWKLADLERDREKRPIDEQAAAVQQKWLTIMNPAKDEGAALDARRKAYLKRKQDELDAIAAEETRKRQEEAKAKALAEAPPDLAPDELDKIAETVAAEVAPVEAERATAGTAYGRNSGLKKVKRGKIVDMVAFLTANADNSDVKELAQKIANRLAKAGHAVEGMEIIEVME